MTIFDDVVGPVVTAKQIAEERDENAKQLMIALGNKQPASAKEIAELVDKTTPKDLVGIAFALGFKIQEKREQVTMRLMTAALSVILSSSAAVLLASCNVGGGGYKKREREGQPKLTVSCYCLLSLASSRAPHRYLSMYSFTDLAKNS